MVLQGLSAFAAEIGIIDANGQLPGVRVQGEMNLSKLCPARCCTHASPNAGKCHMLQAVHNVDQMLQRSGTQLPKVVQTFTRHTYQFLCWSPSLQQPQCNRVSRPQGLSAYLALLRLDQRCEPVAEHTTTNAVFTASATSVLPHPCSMGHKQVPHQAAAVMQGIGCWKLPA